MSTFEPSYLKASWRSWWSSDLRRIGPEWLHLVWTVLFSMVIAAGFTIIGFALFARGEGAWRNWQGWLDWYGLNLAVALSVGLVIHALFRLGERWLGAERIRAFPGPMRGLYFGGLPVLGTAIGWPLAGALLGQYGPGWFRLSDPNTIVGSLLLSVLISLVIYQFFAAKEQQAQAEKRATEAQLRLLQGQIEPHFLFNTLAGVISLIDHDAPRAKAMLQNFTDYLRASLTTLRRDQGPLAQELELAEHYLKLLQSRMEDRLQFSISADEAARSVPVPPLLLQPLVENAVHHGLEPTVDGGRVDVRARVQAGLLVLEVQDNGRGLDAAPRRAARPGAGMALANLRERLQALHGPRATLELTPAQPGTLVRLTLPIPPTTARAPS
jgi:two-component sensor histidine kinase